MTLWRKFLDNLEPGTKLSGYYQECHCCGVAFIASDPRRLYCSDACKVKAHRERKEKCDPPNG